MRVIQTIASTRIDHGGTSRSIPQLCDALVEHGLDNYLVTTTPADASIPCNFPSDRGRVHTTPENRIARQWGVSKRFIQILSALAVSPNQTIIHDHAVWLPTNHAVASYAHRHSIARVVSPRGMLGEWALGNGRWKKRIAWWLYQHRDLRRANGFHATSELEAMEIRRLGLTQPLVVAPNGLELPDTLPSPTGPTSKQFLFLSRIHRKKGLLELLNAWKESSAPMEGWRLRIAGPDDGGYRAVVERRIVELHLESSVSLVGEVTGTAKWQLICSSAFFILPSFNENFGIAIAEALACGVPVITTKNTPWECIAEKQAGWWIEHEHEALVNAINAAVNLQTEDWQRRSLAAIPIGRSYRWAEICQILVDFYMDMHHRISTKARSG